jgi:hypothetical protein
MVGFFHHDHDHERGVLVPILHALVHTVGCNGIRVDQDSISVKKVEAKLEDKVLTWEYEQRRLLLRLSMHPKRCGEEDYVINASVEHVWEEDHSHYGGVSSFCSLTSRQHPRRMLLVQRDGDI